MLKTPLTRCTSWLAFSALLVTTAPLPLSLGVESDSELLAQLEPLYQQSPQTLSVEAMYNLGTLSQRLGNSGPARAYLERAHQLSPQNPSILHNLQRAKNALVQQLGSEEALDPASTVWDHVSDALRRPELGALRAALCLLTLLALIRAYSKHRSLLSLLSSPIGRGLGLLLLALIGIEAATRLVPYGRPAIALKTETIRTGPADHYTALNTLTPGVAARVLESPDDSEWKQIRFQKDGGIGWVKASSLLML